jgi:hypothetical protein
MQKMMIDCKNKFPDNSLPQQKFQIKLQVDDTDFY